MPYWEIDLAIWREPTFAAKLFFEAHPAVIAAPAEFLADDVEQPTPGQPATKP
jgi:hypothetical protein